MKFKFYKYNGEWHLTISDADDNILKSVSFKEEISQEEVLTVVTTLARAEGIETHVDFTERTNNVR